MTALLGPLGYEAQALSAIGLEGEAAASQAAWQAFIAAAPSSPWLDQAKAHLGAGPRAPRHR